jgi:hypothetical protein
MSATAVTAAEVIPVTTPSTAASSSQPGTVRARDSGIDHRPPEPGIRPGLIRVTHRRPPVPRATQPESKGATSPEYGWRPRMTFGEYHRFLEVSGDPAIPRDALSEVNPFAMLRA